MEYNKEKGTNNAKRGAIKDIRVAYDGAGLRDIRNVARYFATTGMACIGR